MSLMLIVMLPWNTSMLKVINNLDDLHKLEPEEEEEYIRGVRLHDYWRICVCTHTRDIYVMLIDINSKLINTCKMSQSDQATLLPKRYTHPSNQLSSLPEVTAMIDFVGSMFSAFSSFGPFNNAIDNAPQTHINVPTILAIVLKLRMLTFSIL